MECQSMLLFFTFFLSLPPAAGQGICGNADAVAACTQYVDPRIGSEGEGRTFVGPSAPFGMVKPGPDCVTMPNAGWAPMPESVKGFSQTHVSGTGGGQKYGNVLIQPLRKSVQFSTSIEKIDKSPKSCGVDKPKGVAAPFSVGDKLEAGFLLLSDGSLATIPVFPQRRQKEEISLGYYSCTYDDGITTEITTAPRCAVYRFTGADALYVDAASFLGMDTIPDKRETQQYVGSAIKTTASNEIVGYSSVRGGWNNGSPYTVFFCLQSDKPLRQVEIKDSLYCLVSLELPDSSEDSETTVKVGISYVSIDQARRNITPLSFDEQLDTLRGEWSTMLGAVPYNGTEKENRMFYTALYHTLLMPVDKTGEQPKRWNIDNNHKPQTYFDDYYAIWDTYRTSFPLLMEYYPDVAVKMVNSLLNIYQHEGYMPDARSGDCNGRTQGGSNAEVVIAEAFARGLKGIDYKLALKAMVKDAEVPPADDEKEGRGGLKEYNELGYIPYGVPRAGTRTIEYSYDDWCIAQVAKGLGNNALYKKYLKRSRNWQNLWRADYEWQGMRGFIMPKDAEGSWLDSVPWGKSRVFHPTIPYRPDTKVAPWYIAWWNTFFYEALSAEYSLSVPHDIPTLIKFCGGDSAFRKRLDTFFDNGHYNVGNEPSFLTPYLYSCIGRADLASWRVSQIVNRHFNDTPTGLPGNDDSGAMSSWLIWAMLGRYPVAGQGKYINITPVHIAGEPSATSGKLVHFVLNRQYRNWQLSAETRSDTLFITCHGNLYETPKNVVEHGKGFCWLSPYREGSVYRADGTFLFISRDALQALQANGSFVYDGITWRRVGSNGAAIHVRADIDNTEMWIDSLSPIPWVMKMENNPLGIDWTIEEFCCDSK